MALDAKLFSECADWIAEQLTNEYQGFISAEFIEAVMIFEREFRDAAGDPGLPHATVIPLLFRKLSEDEGVPTGWAGLSPVLLDEILHMEDEFMSLAGSPRNIRR